MPPPAKGVELMLGEGRGLRVTCGDAPFESCMAAARPVLRELVGLLDAGGRAAGGPGPRGPDAPPPPREGTPAPAGEASPAPGEAPPPALEGEAPPPAAGDAPPPPAN